MRQLAVWTCLIDCFRELVCQHLGNLIDRDVVLGCELANDIAPQHLFDLVGRNRQVLSVSEPRIDLITEAGLLQLGDDGVQAALIACSQNFAEHCWQHGGAKLPRMPELSSESRIPIAGSSLK
jgi:hypothetical protein